MLIQSYKASYSYDDCMPTNIYVKYRLDIFKSSFETMITHIDVDTACKTSHIINIYALVMHSFHYFMIN